MAQLIADDIIMHSCKKWYDIDSLFQCWTLIRIWTFVCILDILTHYVFLTYLPETFMGISHLFHICFMFLYLTEDWNMDLFYRNWLINRSSKLSMQKMAVKFCDSLLIYHDIDKIYTYILSNCNHSFKTISQKYETIPFMFKCFMHMCVWKYKKSLNAMMQMN